MKNIDDQKFARDVMLWQEEVESIVGETQVYVYPYGEWEVTKNGQITNKHKNLEKAGFKLFCGVGMKSFFSYLPNTNNSVLFMDRKCVDGNTLKANHKELAIFFNPLLVIDKSRPKHI